LFFSDNLNFFNLKRSKRQNDYTILMNFLKRNWIMKYRILGLLGVMALTAGSLQAQDYDDIYYDASKAQTTTKTKKVKAETPVKTVAVYGEVPEKYQVVANSNYRTERDVDEYNRRGAYEPTAQTNYEIDINGDTIYFDVDSVYEEDAFANTRRIERFYNPDIVILSDDDDLVELYYDESPTINLIVGSDWGYNYSYGWGASYYPWYTGWYEPWYTGWYTPWYRGWYYSPWYYSYSPWRYGWYSYWGSPYFGWWGHNHWGWGHHYADWGWSGHNYSHTGRPTHNYHHNNGYTAGQRAGLAANRNTRGRVDGTSSNRNGIAPRGTDGNRSSVGMSGNRNRSGYATSHGGNMGSRNSSGVTSRSGAVSRSTGSYSGSSSSRSSGSRSTNSYNSGSSRGSGSYSHGSSSSHGSSGSYSSGSSGGHSSGGGSHGGSSGGGGRRR
jgi:hypothetical protein